MSAFPLQTNAGPLSKDEAVMLAAFKDSPVWAILKRYFNGERAASASALMDIDTGPEKVNYHRGKYASFAFIEDWVENEVPRDVAAALDLLRQEDEARRAGETA